MMCLYVILFLLSFFFVPYTARRMSCSWPCPSRSSSFTRGTGTFPESWHPTSLWRPWRMPSCWPCTRSPSLIPSSLETTPWQKVLQYQAISNLMLYLAAARFFGGCILYYSFGKNSYSICTILHNAYLVRGRVLPQPLVLY